MLESLDISSVTPVGNDSFEWVEGVAGFAVDPADEANGRIVDLELARRNGDGRVRFEADVRMLRPAGGGTGRALLTVPNRGMLGTCPFSLDAEVALDTHRPPEPGDGWLLGQGWTLAWCGWQWDVPRPKGWLGLTAPLADVTEGWMRVEFRLDSAEPDHPLGDSFLLFDFAEYPTSRLDDPEAVLTVRTSPLGQKRVVPRPKWRFTDETNLELDGEFQPFHWYELVYRSTYAPVVGVGLLAIRDFAAFLRRSHEHVFALGISQCGRFLREFLFHGLNRDEYGVQVFDGVFAHIASARRGEFNHRYAQPALTHPLTPGYGPPYDTTGLLERQRTVGCVPKLIQTNSAWEYWRGDGALVHQDPSTGADLPEVPDSRVFLLAGTDHVGLSPIKALLPVANPTHQLDPTPILRALFDQLVQWACDGVEPVASRVPRHAHGTIAERTHVLEAFGAGSLPDPAHLPRTPTIDPSSTSWPLPLGGPTVALVSAVDSSGNELAGIRLPQVAVPVAAYTGWNPRKPVEGLPDVLYEMLGSQLPLQHRVDVPERSDYESAIRAAAGSLVTERLMLARDVERTVEVAMKAYDDRA